MLDVMAKAKAKYGEDYAVAGGDGVHPDPNGHLVIAYAFLKALGCDGNIGTITVDLAANKATATDGHKVLAIKDGSVDIESTRYPFCFSGDPKSPDATTGIIEFFPFNQDLNRYTLIVTNPGPATKLKITWGTQSKEFPAADLAKGINLAAEFLNNPFSEPFKKVEQTIRQQQNFETLLVKQILASLPQYTAMVPQQKDAAAKFAPGRHRPRQRHEQRRRRVRRPGQAHDQDRSREVAQLSRRLAIGTKFRHFARARPHIFTADDFLRAVARPL